MIEQQQKLVLSPYMEIYELVILKDNFLRKIKELVDFGFNNIIIRGNRSRADEFQNKDAGMYQCKAGHLAIHKYLDKRKKRKRIKIHG